MKMVGMAEMGAPISLDCWCVCLCYLHFAQKIQKMAKCTFWYQLARDVPDKVQIAVKWLCVCVCVCDCVCVSCILCRCSTVPDDC